MNNGIWYKYEYKGQQYILSFFIKQPEIKNRTQQLHIEQSKRQTKLIKKEIAMRKHTVNISFNSMGDWFLVHLKMRQTDFIILAK